MFSLTDIMYAFCFTGMIPVVKFTEDFLSKITLYLGLTAVC